MKVITIITGIIIAGLAVTAVQADEWECLLDTQDQLIVAQAGERPFGERGHPGRFGRENKSGRMQRPGRGGIGQFAEDYGEKLMNFLNENVPVLAEKLKSLREENPKKFYMQLASLGKTFGPVMMEMKRNPEGGKLGLKAIEIRLKIAQAKKAIKDGSVEDKAKATEDLRANLNDLFDVIIQHGKVRVTEIAKRLEKWESMDYADMNDAPPPPPPSLKEDIDGFGVGNRPGRGPGSPAFVNDRMRRHRPKSAEHLEQIQQKISEGKIRLDYWQTNKETIVEKRLEQILKNEEHPFPWNR